MDSWLSNGQCSDFRKGTWESIFRCSGEPPGGCSSLRCPVMPVLVQESFGRYGRTYLDTIRGCQVTSLPKVSLLEDALQSRAGREHLVKYLYFFGMKNGSSQVQDLALNV